MAGGSWQRAEEQATGLTETFGFGRIGFKWRSTRADIFPVSHIPPIILVIDDDPDFVEFIGSIIESENCRAVVATESLAGFLLAREVRPKLILCDFAMPGLDGGEFLRMVQEDEGLAHVPRVLMSGHGCPDLSRIPADAFIAKPINTQSLRRLVRAFTRPQRTAVDAN
jgi:CheY-like chemotaxis protein